MSKFSRRRLSISSLSAVAVASFLGAALVGSVGCAGGSNPFCCDSKEKTQIDHLERAQSLDENEKNSKPTEENSDENQEEKQKSTIHTQNPLPDGSGDETQIADATPKTFKQEVPVTVSPSDAAQDSSASNADLVPAPVLPAVQTPQAAPAAAPELATPSENAPEETNETPAEAPVEPETAAASPADEQAPVENQEAQAQPSAPETPSQEVEDAQETAEPQEEKTPEPPVAVSRLPRRNGPQRAASRQVAQRAAKQPVAVPQTRAASTLSAPAPVVTFRTRAVVPAVSTSAAPAPVVTFRTRTVVP
jgi:hypothetical protein